MQNYFILKFFANQWETVANLTKEIFIGIV